MSPADHREYKRAGLRIVLFSLGGILLAGMLICAGACFLVYRTIAPALDAGIQVLEDTVNSEAAARGFLEALRENRLDEAYGMTTNVFQARMSRQNLEDFCSKQVGLQDSSSIDTNQLTFAVENLHTRIFSYPLPVTDGQAVAIQLTVVKDGGRFGIDTLDVVPMPQVPESGELPSTPAVPIEKEPTNE